MNTVVTVEEKKEYLRWFLTSHKLKRLECVWLLNYIISNDRLLSNTIFTDDVHCCPNGLEITSTEAEDAPFGHYRDDDCSNDVENAFQYLKNNENEKLYIQLNYPNNNTCTSLVAVKEDNGFAVTDPKTLEQDLQIVDELITHVTANTIREVLLKNIDYALDSGNKELFMKLSGELLEL